MTSSELAKYLEDKARAKKPVFYRDVVAHFDLIPLTDAWTNHPLADAFDVLDRQDADAGRPFRTSMVISKERGMPGPGFFKSLEQLKGTVARNDRQRLDVSIAEMNAAIKYPWRDPDAKMQP